MQDSDWKGFIQLKMLSVSALVEETEWCACVWRLLLKGSGKFSPCYYQQNMLVCGSSW